MTNITESKKGRAAVGLAAGAFGIVASLAAAAVGTDSGRNDPGRVELAQSTQEISGNCDEVEHANDPECVGVVVPARDRTATTVRGGSTSTSTSTTTPTPTATQAPSVRTVSAGDAGFVTVAFDGAQLQVGRTAPNPGWRVEMEESVGREVEVTFTNGSRRIDVNVELEDGQIRERVRERADDGDHHGDDGFDDSSGPGPGDDDDGDDDSSGPGSGDDDDDDDDDSSGSGSDDE